MAAFGGRQEGAGRPKGSQSKIGKEVREAIKQALDELGGVSYLKGLAVSSPKAFATLVAKIVPNEIEMDIRFNDLSEEEINFRLNNTVAALATSNDDPDKSTAH